MAESVTVTVKMFVNERSEGCKLDPNRFHLSHFRSERSFDDCPPPPQNCNTMSCCDVDEACVGLLRRSSDVPSSLFGENSAKVAKPRLNLSC